MRWDVIVISTELRNDGSGEISRWPERRREISPLCSFLASVEMTEPNPSIRTGGTEIDLHEALCAGTLPYV